MNRGEGTARVGGDQQVNLKRSFYNQLFSRGSEFSSYEIELRNRIKQNYVTLQVTNSKIFIESLFSSN